ncbi:MAG: hypothetical protein JXB38_20415 [Anaerolineales bacterium]|nr:hypothetical protein [Anaerolineales bacterium]
MSSFIYNKGKMALLDGSVDLDDDTIKVALVTASYTPDKADDEFFEDVTNEVSGTGYAAGGKPLANMQLIQDDAYNRVIVDADDTTWPLAAFTTRAVVVYKDTGEASSSPLIAYLDFENDRVASGEDFTLEWGVNGVFYLGE